MPDHDDTPLDSTDTPAPRRKVTLRRFADTPYESPFTYDEDEDTSTGFKRRWWHIAGALILIGILMLEILLPVIEGILQAVRFIPSTLGEPL